MEQLDIPARTWAEIDLAALRYNLQTVRRLAGPAMDVMAVVKANAYGHGSEAVGLALERAGAAMLACADIEEAMIDRARFERKAGSIEHRLPDSEPGHASQHQRSER